MKRMNPHEIEKRLKRIIAGNRLLSYIKEYEEDMERFMGYEEDGTIVFRFDEIPFCISNLRSCRIKKRENAVYIKPDKLIKELRRLYQLLENQGYWQEVENGTAHH